MQIQILIVGILSIIAIALSIYSCLKKEPFNGNVLAIEDGKDLELVALNLNKILEGYVKWNDQIKLGRKDVTNWEHTPKWMGYLSWSGGIRDTRWLDQKGNLRAFATWQQSATDATALTIMKS